MPSRRQIREAVVQFLYCADLEGGADPTALKDPFWDFVTESRLAIQAHFAQCSSMSTLSIPMPDADLAFLCAFAKEQGTSPEGFLAQHARNLRLNLQSTLHSDVLAASGTFTATSDPLSEFFNDMAKKHQ